MNPTVSILLGVLAGAGAGYLAGSFASEEPVSYGTGVEAPEIQISRLRNELDEPPDEFRDPVMLTLMREPMVISSGHVFDRDTVYDRGAFRFQACPMTRQRIKDHAFPLVYLKAKIVDFKLRRIDGILGAGTRAATRAAQMQLGLPADGWPTPALLSRL